MSILSEVRLVHSDVFTSAASAIAPRVRELRPAEVMRCTRAMSRCGVKHDSFCQSIGDDVVGRWSKGQSHSGFRCEDLVELCWCFASLEAFHQELLQLMFQVLRETQKVTADALCQLYELHLSLELAPQSRGIFEKQLRLAALRAEHKDRYAPFRIEDKAVSSLLEHYKACELHPQPVVCRRIAAIAADVLRKYEVISLPQ